MFVAFTVGALVFKRTRYEEADFAIGGSEEAARLLEMKVDRVKITAYTVSGALADFAGALQYLAKYAGDQRYQLRRDLHKISPEQLQGFHTG